MLSQLFRSSIRQTFKSVQNNYIIRCYSNQDLNQKTINEDNDCKQKYYRFDNFDELAKLYHEYYRRYYYTFKNKFDNKSSDGQTDTNYSEQKNNQKSYSFGQVFSDAFTTKLLEKCSFIGAAFLFGVHIKNPCFNPLCGCRKGCSPRRVAQTPKCEKNWYLGFDICGNCKYCQIVRNKFTVLSAPILLGRKNYIFPKINKRYIKSDEQNQTPIINEIISDQINDKLNDEIPRKLKADFDPIEDICKQLESASIEYTDKLCNIIGFALINTDPEEALKCWSSAKTSSKALFNLGVAFESGHHSTGGTVDLEQAYKYYLFSASMGHKLAIYNLSLFYLKGKGGIAADLDRAEALLNRAAKLGVKPAQKYIEALNTRRNYLLKEEKTAKMRSSASAPNLMNLNTCVESYNKEMPINKFTQNYGISNRV